MRVACIVFDHADRSWAFRRACDQAWMNAALQGLAHDMALQTDGDGGAQRDRRVEVDAEDLRGRRLVLPAELLLDQPASSMGDFAASASR